METLVLMEKVKEDTVYGGKFLYDHKIKIQDSTIYLTKYCDAENLYVIRHNEKLIIRFDPSKGKTTPN